MKEIITFNPNYIGTASIGIKTPIIRPGDNLEKIVIGSCLRAVGGFQDKAAIGITEAVVAIAQENFATPEDIQADIANKYPDANDILLYHPIQSRNRFMGVAKAIAGSPQIKHLTIVLSFPCDEVGNRLVSDEIMSDCGVNLYEEAYSAREFYEIFGKPCHPCTGKDYIEEYQKACSKNGTEVDILITNNMDICGDLCDNILVCTIRQEQRDMEKEYFSSIGKKVYDLSEILNQPVNGSGYSPEYGLYGSNLLNDGTLKLMPRNCQEFVNGLQKKIFDDYEKRVEVFIFGDGAFKDPKSGIWELADPTTTPGNTSGIAGTPQEVKLKYIASQHPNATQDQLKVIVAREKEDRMLSGDITSEASLGTTPRQKTDILSSLADLTTGSGDKQTPVVYILNFL